MIESVIIFHGIVDYFDATVVEGRLFNRLGNDLYEISFYAHEFPISTDDLCGDEIFYINAAGNIELPKPLTQEELDKAKTEGDLLAILFEGSKDPWNSPSETGATAEVAPSDGRSSQDSD